MNIDENVFLFVYKLGDLLQTQEVQLLPFHQVRRSHPTKQKLPNVIACQNGISCHRENMLSGYLLPVRTTFTALAIWTCLSLLAQKEKE